MVRESSHHLTIRLQTCNLWLQEFQTMYAWNISVIFKDLAALLENKQVFLPEHGINKLQIYVHHKSAICTHAVSTRQNPTFTPKQTPKADPMSALCPLQVYFLKICVSSKSAMVYSGSALGVRFTHCSVVQTHHFSYHLDLRVYFRYSLLSMSTLDQPGGVLLGVSSGVTTADPKQTQSMKTQKTDPKFG